MKMMENNQKIVDFLGLEKCNMCEHCGGYRTNSIGEYSAKMGSIVLTLDKMSYHTRWDWLMPVVEKIEAIKDDHHGRFGVYIGSNGCTIQATNFRSDKMSEPPMYYYDATLNTKIDSTYHCVIKFIDFYNEHIKNKENEN